MLNEEEKNVFEALGYTLTYDNEDELSIYKGKRKYERTYRDGYEYEFYGDTISFTINKDNTSLPTITQICEREKYSGNYLLINANDDFSLSLGTWKTTNKTIRKKIFSIQYYDYNKLMLCTSKNPYIFEYNFDNNTLVVSNEFTDKFTQEVANEILNILSNHKYFSNLINCYAKYYPGLLESFNLVNQPNCLIEKDNTRILKKND